MTNGYCDPRIEPYSPYQADLYLRVHGDEAIHADKARWITTQHEAYRETGDGRTYDWSHTRWLQHQRAVAA